MQFAGGCRPRRSRFLAVVEGYGDFRVTPAGRSPRRRYPGRGCLLKLEVVPPAVGEFRSRERERVRPWLDVEHRSVENGVPSRR